MTASSTDNPCKADWERRKRALNDSELISRVGNMERRISFEVGYDHRAHPEACGGGGHGQHGMTLRFILIGPKGATQFVMNAMNWVPGNIRHGNVDRVSDASLYVPTNPRIDDAYAIDLGYHSPKPLYDGHEEWGHQDECHLLPEGSCFYDGSGLNAEPILEAFLNYGPMAIWSALARYYQETFGEVESDG